MIGSSGKELRLEGEKMESRRPALFVVKQKQKLKILGKNNEDLNSL